MYQSIAVTKMVLPLEQCAFIVKWYCETHSLKSVHDDFIQEFLNSVSSSNYAILNLIFLNSKTDIKLNELLASDIYL